MILYKKIRTKTQEVYLLFCYDYIIKKIPVGREYVLDIIDI
jgi:hypothetical protein